MEDKLVHVDFARIFGAAEVRSQRFAIFIPERDRHGEVIDQAKWLKKALDLLSDICGGATAMPPDSGAWLNKDTRKLIVEKPILVYTFIDPEPFARRLHEIVDLMYEIGRQTNQGQMAIEYDSALYLVDIDETVSPQSK
jgi:hypothetical protein